jgi:hypothetical protein
MHGMNYIKFIFLLSNLFPVILCCFTHYFRDHRNFCIQFLSSSGSICMCVIVYMCICVNPCTNTRSSKHVNLVLTHLCFADGGRR